jgi:hypothetical protein
MNEKKPNFNERHPELQAGEMWLANDVGSANYERNPHFEYGYETARLGEVAYHRDGRRLEGYRPVFVQFWEHQMKAAMLAQGTARARRTPSGLGTAPSN